MHLNMGHRIFSRVDANLPTIDLITSIVDPPSTLIV